MKKNILYGLFLMLILFPLGVYADSISLNCPSEIEAGSSFSCELMGNSSRVITALSATVDLSNQVSFGSFITNSSLWQGDGGNGQIELYTEKTVTGTFKIGTLKLTSNGNGDNIIVINSVVFYDENDKAINVDSVSKNVTIKNNNPSSSGGNGDSSVEPKPSSKSSSSKPSNDGQGIDEEPQVVSSAYLTDILIDGYTLDFDREVFEYTLKIGNEKSLKITPVLEDSEAEYAITGNDLLENGSVIKIIVTSLDGEKQVYSITINKDVVPEKKDYTLYFSIVIGILIIINVVRLVKSGSKKKTSE